MKLKYISAPVKIFMTVLIILIGVHILQVIIIEAAIIFAHKEHIKMETPAEPKKELSEQKKRTDRIRNSAKEFLPDGTIHLVYKPGRKRYIYDSGDWQREMNAQEKVEIYDANDNLLWDGPIKDRPYKYLSWAEPPSPHRDAIDERRLKETLMITPEFSQALETPVFNSEKEVMQVWRYKPAKEHFVGYNTAGEKIGYISAAGFTNSKTGAEPLGKFKLFTAWCPKDSSSPTMLWQTKRCIYQINFENQSVELILVNSLADIERIALLAWRDLKPDTMEDTTAEMHRPTIYYQTEDRKHHLIMRKPDQKLTINTPDDWDNRFISFTATKQSVFLKRYISERTPPEDYYKSPKLLKQWRDNLRGKTTKEAVELYKVAEDGNLILLNHYDWTVPNQFAIPTEYPMVRVRHITTGHVSNFSPPLYDFVWHFWGPKLWEIKHYSTEPMREFLGVIEYLHPSSSMLNWLISAAMMGFVLLHGWPRRTSWAKLIFWLIFVGAFNLAGLLTYWALNHTTVIKCPSCGKRRGLLKSNCARCGSKLPAPQPGKLDLIFNN